jgi:hypothetical protein
MRRIEKLILGLVVVIALSAQLMGATGQVGTCLSNVTKLGNSIQTAVSALPPNSTLFVCPGTYPEQVIVTQPITINGVKDPNSTAAAAVITAPTLGMVANSTSLASGNPIAAQLVLENSSGNANINNITVDANNNQISDCGPELIGIYYRNASGTVNNVSVLNQALSPAGLNGCQSGLGIFVQSGNAGASTVTVRNSYVANYQKNGITGNEVGTNLTVSLNTVFGQGPTTGAAENGIQFGFGATGSANFNTVMDNVYSPGTAAATGILVFASTGVVVKSNTVGNSQLGISIDSDPMSGSADGGTVVSNKVSATHQFDGIDLCSNNNTANKNIVVGSDESAIHFDSSCVGTGNNNSAVNNTISESCVGILEDSGTSGNSVGSNVFHSVTNTTGSGCTTPPGARGKKQILAPKPVRP